MDHHLQLSYCPPLFHNFWQFNVKEAAAHLPIIQKEVDGLLGKGVIEPSSGGAGFYCNIFVVPKHIGGLWPILNLKHFNCYLHIPSFKMPTIRHVLAAYSAWWLCFLYQSTGCLILHIPIVKHHHHFLQFVWHNPPHQWKALPFGLAIVPRVFTALTKPILFLCMGRVSVLLSI